MKATKSPTVMRPAMTWCPPYQRTMTIPSPEMNMRRGWKRPEAFTSAMFRFR